MADSELAARRFRGLVLARRGRDDRGGFWPCVHTGTCACGWGPSPWIGAGAATHFNSDLEAGSARKGLPDGVGPPGAGIWRLELSSLLDIEVLSYARTSDGFVTSLHDTAPAAAGVHRVVFLNPGRNVDQVSRLRLINPGTEDAFVTIAARTTWARSRPRWSWTSRRGRRASGRRRNSSRVRARTARWATARASGGCGSRRAVRSWR